MHGILIGWWSLIENLDFRQQISNYMQTRCLHISWQMRDEIHIQQYRSNTSRPNNTSPTIANLQKKLGLNFNTKGQLTLQLQQYHSTDIA